MNNRDSSARTAIIDWLGAFATLASNGEYQLMSSMIRNSRLDVTDIQRAINDYGRTVLPYPESAFSHLIYGQTENVASDTWYAVMPLWTHEEERSDLTIEITMTMRPDGTTNVSVDDLHVL